MSDTSLRDDLLVGAEPIADFTGLTVRQVYYAAEHGTLPIGRLGSLLRARKSELEAALSATANKTQAA